MKARYIYRNRSRACMICVECILNLPPKVPIVYDPRSSGKGSMHLWIVLPQFPNRSVMPVPFS